MLKLLNCNSENPYLIWNNGTRAELLEFLEAQQESNIKRVRQEQRFYFILILHVRLSLNYRPASQKTIPAPSEQEDLKRAAEWLIKILPSVTCDQKVVGSIPRVDRS